MECKICRAGLVRGYLTAYMGGMYVKLCKVQGKGLEEEGDHIDHVVSFPKALRSP